jgi:HAD superfamily hydrolase (TIGR01509 family)
MEEVALIEQNIGGPLPHDFHPRYVIERDRALAAQVEAVRGVRAVLDGLIAQERRFCVASGADIGKMQVTLGRTGLLPLFEGRMFSATDVPLSKPAPDVYLLAARSMDVHPARCAVIEDTPTGVRAGVAAGMTVFGYAERTDGRALLQAGAHATFADMRELPAMLA